MIKAIDERDAVAQALGIDTTEYQKAVKACTEDAIKATADQLTAGIELTGLREAVAALPLK